MIDPQDIISAAEEALGDGELFLVEVKVRGDEVEVFIDSDGRVTVDDCVALTKAIESRFALCNMMKVKNQCYRSGNPSKLCASTANLGAKASRWFWPPE